MAETEVEMMSTDQNELVPNPHHVDPKLNSTTMSSPQISPRANNFMESFEDLPTSRRYLNTSSPIAR